VNQSCSFLFIEDFLTTRFLVAVFEVLIKIRTADTIDSKTIKFNASLNLVLYYDEVNGMLRLQFLRHPVATSWVHSAGFSSFFFDTEFNKEVLPYKNLKLHLGGHTWNKKLRVKLLYPMSVFVKLSCAFSFNQVRLWSIVLLFYLNPKCQLLSLFICNRA